METWDIPAHNNNTSMEMDIASFHSGTTNTSHQDETSINSNLSSVVSISQPLPPAEGTTFSALLNLLSSMVGGGSLSLPLAFCLSGNAGVSPVLLLFFAITADFSIMCLIDSSRLQFGIGPRARRKSSYEAVAQAAFGPRMKEFSMVLVVLICFFGCVGYCVLLRDLMDPLAHYLSHLLSGSQSSSSGLNTSSTISISKIFEFLQSSNDNETAQSVRGPSFMENTTMWVIILCITPLCTLQTLTSLQNVGAASMVAVTLVAMCISYRSYQCNFSDTDYHIRHGNWKTFINYTPVDFNSFLTSLPLLLSCYICHFNVISVHNEFRTPTTKKIKKTIHCTTLISTLFYLWIGWAGSLYANCTPSGHVQGNVLLDFPDGDDLLLMGRICLACTIAFAFPMMVLPARDTILRLFDARFLKHSKNPAHNLRDGTVPTEIDDHREMWANGLSALGGVSGAGGEDISACSVPSSYKENAEEQGVAPMEMDSNFFDPLLENDGLAPVPTISFDNLLENQKIPKITMTKDHEEERPDRTRSIVGICFFWIGAILASFVHSVDVVWGLAGSSIAILIGFLIPFAAFVKISHRAGKKSFGGGYKSDFGSGTVRVKIAKVLVVIYTILMTACTWHAFATTF